MCPGVGGLEQHETKAAQKRQKQQRVWDRSSRSNVRCGGQLQTWPGQRFPSMHIWSISGNAICICCNSTAPGERTELRCELRSHTLSDSLVETPHPPLENHRTVSSRWHSQDFSYILPFFLELFARMLPLRTSMCFTWLPAEGTQRPRRSKMRSSGSE